MSAMPTPRPWHKVKDADGGCYVVFGPDNRGIASFVWRGAEEDKDNAELSISAVNSHDAAIELVDAILDQGQDWQHVRELARAWRKSAGQDT